MSDTQFIKEKILNSIIIKQRLYADDESIEVIAKVAQKIAETLKGEGKILLCGNGGSASDALHISAEFVGRFQKERQSLAALALNADVSAITAISNDYGYNKVFSRQVESMMKSQDVLIGISTSGNSENVYQAILEAKKKGISIALLGNDGGKIQKIADYSIIVPCNNTARIQECHIMIGHIICEIVENELF